MTMSGIRVHLRIVRIWLFNITVRMSNWKDTAQSAGIKMSAVQAVKPRLFISQERLRKTGCVCIFCKIRIIIKRGDRGYKI